MISQPFSDAAAASLKEVQVPTTPEETPTVEGTTSGEIPPPNEDEGAKARRWKLKDPEGDFEVDEKELTDGHLRHRDYTRKAQAVAEQRKTLEANQAALTSREQKINHLLSDGNNVKEYYEFLTGEKLTPTEAKRVDEGLTPSGESDEVATLKEAQHFAKVEANAMRDEIRQEILEHMAKGRALTQRETAEQVSLAETQRNALTYQDNINTTIKAIAEEHSILNDTYDLKELETMLCSEVMTLEPKSFDEAKEMLIQAAAARASRLEEVFGKRQKDSALKKGKLVKDGIEPPGGNAPGTTAVKHKLGDKALTAGAIAFMEQAAKS